MSVIMKSVKLSPEKLKEGMSSEKRKELYIEDVKHIKGTVYNTGDKRKRSTSPSTVRKKFQCCASEKNDKNYSEKLSHVEEILSDESIQFVLRNRKKELEKIPGNSSLRKKLTQNNIRTILRHVLSNKYIFTMLQRILKGEYNNPSELKIETGFEPRLTRLKAREMMTKQCEVLSWPVASPAKKLLLDEEFPEESSDEEYRPNKDEIPSDEDEATSVKTSEFGSPQSRISLCSSPVSKVADPISEDEDALVIAIPENETYLGDNSEAGKIAQRTRSKQPLTDTPLALIGASFIPPDITVDMYDTGNNNDLNDNPWKNFLCELSLPIESTVVAVSDENEQEPEDVEDDPEYFPSEEEVEEDDINLDYSFLDMPESAAVAENAEEQENVDDPRSISIENKMDGDYFFLNDSTEILNDELNDLMTGIFEFAQQDLKDVRDDQLNDVMTEISEFAQQDLRNVRDDESKTNNTVPCIKIVEVVHVKNVNTKVLWMNPEERRQLDEQMRMHVQLLTQSYLLSHGNPQLNFINVSSKIFLEEIKMFADREIAIDETSAFHSHNLDGSLAIVQDFEAVVGLFSESSSLKKKPFTAPDVPQHVRETLASSTVFIYPELLPKVGFCDMFRKGKVIFPPAEDNLIALGLEQFAGLKKSVEYIQKLLVPTKTVLQIKRHIKGSRRDRAAENNPIKYYSVHKQAPQRVRVIRMFDPEIIKSPEDFPPSALPQWMAPYSKVEDPTDPIASENSRVVSKLQEPRKFVPILPKNLQFVVRMPDSSSEKTLQPHSDTRENPKHPQKSKRASSVTETTSELDSDYEESLNEVTSELGYDSGSNFAVDNPEEVSDRILRRSKRLADRVPEPVVIKEEIESSDDEKASILESLTCEKSLNLCTSKVVGEMSSISVNDDTGDHYMSHVEEASSCSESNAEFLSMSIKVEEDSASGLQPTLIMALSKKDASETTDACEKSTLFNNEYIMSKNVPCNVIEDAVYIPVTENLQSKKNAPSTFSCIRDMIQSPKGEHNRRNVKESKLTITEWNRDEDKLIISNCQKFGINESSFAISAKSIGSRTVDEVKERFLELLKTLSEKLKYDED